MSTKTYIMPIEPIVARVRPDGTVELTRAMFEYVGGLEDVSARVAAYVDPSTATAAQVAQAMIDAGLMKAS